MTYQDRKARLDDERHLLYAAMARLRDGKPQRSSGKLTAAALAVEAGIGRQRLYEHHGELLTEFKITAGGGPTSPNVQALRQQLADAHDRIQSLEADNTLLTRRITTLCAVITELTHEAQADNVVTLRQTRQR
jgi:hypothetical protein